MERIDSHPRLITALLVAAVVIAVLGGGFGFDQRLKYKDAENTATATIDLKTSSRIGDTQGATLASAKVSAFRNAGEIVTIDEREQTKLVQASYEKLADQMRGRLRTEELDRKEASELINNIITTLKKSEHPKKYTYDDLRNVAATNLEKQAAFFRSAPAIERKSNANSAIEAGIKVPKKTDAKIAKTKPKAKSSTRVAQARRAAQ